MIPFEKALPYDVMMKDVYVTCPFCGTDHVLLPLKPADLKSVSSGAKRLLVFPCCHSRVTLVDADKDYLLTDTDLRRLQ
ncbi:MULTISPECIES: hypothetical protein [unclassified Paenibacillus]|uniref:hypothetical protein n=1 Tax=unclassified Paenibacillus TaxID=185978 RepID=UPI0009546769|nr:MULTISPECIES: hypothetical protein [unclassified Paenibacillus]ASS68849.1 hypothetical protein CIC07_24035 [Paenibacillus sp. RUD330]SIR18082.1 hypothetical protein SAMN05880555_3222 [Paenibacillus sp. RU4X]SIR20889.1 hypothetical protein SAMN05880570_2775 [Paenibacillus sp. RU4T]